MPKWLKPNDCAEQLGVSDESLRRWANEEKIHYIRTPGGHRLYDIDSITGEKSHGFKKEAIIYARVSSSKQKTAGDLERQCQSLLSKYPKYTLIKDVGSGINFKRPGFRKILSMVLEGNIKEVVVEHRDRLCRFGFDLIEWLFERHGVKLTVEDEVETTPIDDLAQDLLSVVTVFSARYNGMRRYQQKRDTNKHVSENKDETDEASGTDTEAVDRDESVDVQQSIKSSKRGREDKFPKSKKQVSAQGSDTKRRRMDGRNT